jgi:hypothetical protein
MSAHSPRIETPDPVSTRRSQALVFLGGMLVLLVSMGVLGSVDLRVLIGLVGIVGLVSMPYAAPEMSLVVLGFAGRYELPPLLSGVADVAMWSAVGLYVFTMARYLSTDRAPVNVNLTHPVSIAFVLLALFAVVSYLPMSGNEYALEKLFRVGVYTVSFLVFTQAVFRDEDAVFRFLKVFVGFVALLASASLITSLAQTGLSGLQRITPPGGGSITLARMTGLAAIACLGMYLARSNRSTWLIGTFAFALVTFLTGSRAPTLFLFLAILVVTLPLMMNRVSRKQGVVLTLALGVGMSLMAAAFAIAINIGLPFAQRYLLLLQSGGGTSITVRTMFIEDALELAQRSPIAGFGVGSWPVITDAPTEVAYPHNYFLEIVVEQGAFALLAAMFAVIITLVTALRLVVNAKSQKSAALATVGLSSFVYAVLIAQTSGDLYDNRYLWFYAGFLVACDTLQRIQPDYDSPDLQRTRSRVRRR